MRLSSNLGWFIAVIAVFAFHSIAFAYDYPVVGQYSQNYQNVFDSIKAGKCDSMENELKTLSDSEGISSDIYKAICYFEKPEADKGFETLQKMLTSQEYDEVLYVTQSRIDKGDSDPRHIKFRGLALFNIGAFEKALTDLDLYLSLRMDEDVLYTIVDINISLKRFGKAEEVLTKAPDKNGRYYYRKGRIMLRTGRTVSALESLREVEPADEKVYPSSRMLIAEICSSSSRFLCAEKQYGLAEKTEEYADVVPEKLVKLEDKQKLFTGFLSLGEQYDTNVTSIDADELPGASEVSSGRTYAVADLKLNFYPGFADTVSLGTMHYKTWNYELPSYNMSTHKLYVQMKRLYDTFEILFPKISADITYFGGERYSTAVSAEASATYKQDTWSLRVPLKVTRSNYEGDEDTGINSKDGYKYKGSLIATKTFMQKYTFKLSGGYSVDDVKGNLKKKADTTFGAALSARLTRSFTPTLAADYGNYDYKKTDREDSYYSVSLKAIYLITPQIFLGGGVTWTKTDSSENAYDYKKTVTEASVSYTF